MPGEGTRSSHPPPSGDPVAELASVLDALEVPYFFTGALALNFWGRQRGTEDIDLVIHGGRVRFAEALNALAEAGFAVDPPAALKESTEEGHTAFPATIEVEGRKADIAVDVILPALPFEKEILARTRRLPWFGKEDGIPVISPEDLVLYKTIYFRRTAFSDDPRDVESVLARTRDLDTSIVLETLSSILPEDDERIEWLREALRKHGFSAGGGSK